MDATRIFDNLNYDNEVYLVVAGKLSSENRQIAIDLNVNVIEDFRYKKDEVQ